MKITPFIASIAIAAIPAVTQLPQATIHVNGTALREKAVVVNGRAYAPVRSLTSALGGSLVSATSSTISISTGSGRYPVTPIVLEDGVMGRTELISAIGDIQEWIEKSELLLSLIEPEMIQDNGTYGSDRMVVAMRKKLGVIKSAATVARYASAQWRIAPYRLTAQEDTLHFCDIVNVGISTLSELYHDPDVASRIGDELSTALMTHSALGYRVLGAVSDHRSGVLEWYEKVAGIPSE